jgi:hypothetical protein
MPCTENSKQIFLEMKLRGLVPNFYIHVSVSDLYIPTIGPQTQYSTLGGPIMEIKNRSQIHECRNWERGRTTTFLRIFVSNFRYSVTQTNRSLGSCSEAPWTPGVSWTSSGRSSSMSSYSGDHSGTSTGY